MTTGFFTTIRSAPARLTSLIVLSIGAAITIASPANALATFSITFDQPSGLVSTTDAIPLLATLTNTGLETFTIENGSITSGITAQDIATFGTSSSGTPFDPADVARIGSFSFFVCSGNFTNSCGPGAYSFTFGPGLPFNFSLAPTESYSLNLFTFSPVGGAAPAGDYITYNLGFGASAFNADNTQLGTYAFASTCPTSTADCAFTRTAQAASAVPEPATWALMIGGFGMVGGTMRARRSARVTASA